MREIAKAATLASQENSQHNERRPLCGKDAKLTKWPYFLLYPTTNTQEAELSEAIVHFQTCSLLGKVDYYSGNGLVVVAGGGPSKSSFFFPFQFESSASSHHLPFKSQTQEMEIQTQIFCLLTNTIKPLPLSHVKYRKKFCHCRIIYFKDASLPCLFCMQS